MKKINILFATMLALSTLSSCNDFLDKLPDNRAEVNSKDKIDNLLASAYSNQIPNFMMEVSSDNVTDNGRQYTANPAQMRMYRWEQVTETTNDSPYMVWNNTMVAIGTANEVLDDIAKVGADQLKPERAEALLCRAYGMFQLANAFCMAYDPSKADSYLGLPYPTKSGVNMTERGTLKELYAQIDKDIEEALPMVNDDHLAGRAAKYHFNRQAAYAFAARFNLYYHNYEKAIKYATEVLGSNPANFLRDYSVFTTLAGREDINNSYISSSSKGNLLLQTAVGASGRAWMGSSRYLRFAHNRAMASYETFWAPGPWGSGSSTNKIYYATLLYGNAQLNFFPKIFEKFEYTDKIAGTGYPHIIAVSFSGEETLLVRAEAYALSKQYDKAIADMNAWQTSHCKTTVTPLTESSINTFVGNLPYAAVTPTSDAMRSIRKTLHPQGFTVATGTQENLIELILHMRRLETLYDGLRFQDIKRYGIEFSHFFDGEEAHVFKAGDLRGALQLPQDVIEAGLAANPR